MNSHPKITYNNPIDNVRIVEYLPQNIRPLARPPPRRIHKEEEASMESIDSVVKTTDSHVDSYVMIEREVSYDGNVRYRGLSVEL